METPDTDGGSVSVKRSACDNCKTRKTKCDRKSPCSGCATLQVQCRTTKKSPERRQRVLISDKYTDAILDVNRKLDAIAASLDHPKGQDGSSQPLNRGLFDNQQYCRPKQNDLLALEGHKGSFRGESSLNGHAKRLRDALRDKYGIQTSRFDDTGQVAISSVASQTDEHVNAHHESTHGKPAASEQSLPPAATTLNLLRLIKVELQRFFIDVPIISEEDFTAVCQQVYFSPEHTPVAAWATTNVGLYYLLHDLQPEHYGTTGLTTSAVSTYLNMLSQNIFAAVASLNLAASPTFEDSQALALLGAFCMKSGYIETAWRLTTFAVRMCMDLGFHRIDPPLHQVDIEDAKRTTVFWWLYAISQCLALTLGRTPAVRINDIATRPGQSGFQRHRGHDRLYAMFIEFPMIIEDITEQLFSVSALKASPTERQKRVHLLEAQLLQCQESLKEANRAEPAREMIYLYAALMLEVILHTLLALVQYPSPGDSPFQVSDACLESSRKAIEALIEVGKLNAEIRPTAWSNFLNMTLSMVPPIPFITLIGHATVTKSPQDMALLETALAVMQPVAVESPCDSMTLDSLQPRTRQLSTSGFIVEHNSRH